MEEEDGIVLDGKCEEKVLLMGEYKIVYVTITEKII